ncbi:glycosyltransferase WbuB [Candidatus Saccharibacteria bacterium RIFCSPHIGHO2_12_FULL_47_16b]|nr:MAG: glycosyltransferase WbuB [Candidatus Saccharibacteria bacterium RIFCSPHIGHO2_12_FULL_47_16b]
MASKKRVLVVSQHFWPESFRINDICDFLLEKDCEIDVLCGLPNYPKGKFYGGYGYFGKRNEVHNKVKIHRVLEIPRASNTNFRIFLNYVSFPFFSLFHIPHMLFRKYDKIFIFQTSPVMMGLAGLLLGKLRRTQTTMYVLDLWPENLYSVIKIKSKFLRKIAAAVSNWHYRRANKLIALSEAMKQQLHSRTKLPDKKILVLPQACEKVYEQDIEDKKLAKRFAGKFNILFTGSITPAQSFETVIAAAKKLKSESLYDINWIIVGDGMSRQWLEEEVKKAGLDDSFIFEGLVPMADIPKYTNFADVLIACLVKSELLEATIPAKVLSYFAAGRPIVLAMDGEVRDLVNNDIKCGLAGPTEDAKTLADNIKKIYSMSPAERQAMGQRGRAYHFKHFERNLILNKLYNFMFNTHSRRYKNPKF